jgi:hypothetical protein
VVGELVLDERFLPQAGIGFNQTPIYYAKGDGLHCARPGAQEATAQQRHAVDAGKADHGDRDDVGKNAATGSARPGTDAISAWHGLVIAIKTCVIG